MRERLVELIGSKICESYSPTCDEYEPHTCEKCYANDCKIGDLADAIIADGWIRPPCKVGDKMYYDGELFASHCKGQIMESTVAFINTEVCSTFRGEVDMTFDFDCFGKTVFLNREDAERALKGGAEE